MFGLASAAGNLRAVMSQRKHCSPSLVMPHGRARAAATLALRATISEVAPRVGPKVDSDFVNHQARDLVVRHSSLPTCLSVTKSIWQKLAVLRGLVCEQGERRRVVHAGQRPPCAPKGWVPLFVSRAEAFSFV